MMEAVVKVNPPTVAVPAGVLTTTSPEAPAPTIAVICVAEFTMKEAAGTPPNLTTVAPVKLAPVMIMALPLPASLGAKEVTVGPVWINPAFVPVPPAVMTATSPEAPGPATAVMLVDEFTVK
jgi:hypothetical protein